MPGKPLLIIDGHLDMAYNALYYRRDLTQPVLALREREDPVTRAALYTEALLKKPTLEQMWTAFTLKSGTSTNYGYGWGVSTLRGRRSIDHGGGIPGFSTYGLSEHAPRYRVEDLFPDEADLDVDDLARIFEDYVDTALALRF